MLNQKKKIILQNFYAYPLPQAVKKKDISGTGPRNAKLSTLEILLASTDAIESGITPEKPIKPF